MVVDAVNGDGWTAAYEGYGDSLWTVVDEDDNVLVRGFLEALVTLEWVEAEWISDYDNPTRVIVVAHSHGTVWAHTALMLTSHVPVDILVDLDGESLGWESDSWTLDTIGDDWRAEVADYVEDRDPGWWFDVGNPANSWSVPGVSTLQDIEDVVPDNVWFNIEVASSSLVVQDAEPNHRLDGSVDGIYRFQSGLSHGDVDDPGSTTMDFVAEVISDVYDPG